MKNRSDVFFGFDAEEMYINNTLYQLEDVCGNY